jgi:hypothetical protein
MARLFTRWLPADRATLTLLGCIDPLLLVVMFTVVFRTYGARVGCIALIIFGLGYPWRYDWIGGALLRLDWLAAVVIGIAMLRRERHAVAGALFAYATMVRIFPVLFLFGPAIVALRALVKREVPRWALRLVGGFALSVALCLAAGSLTGRGVRAWSEFARNLEKHEGTWLTNNVGLENVLLYGPDTMKRTMVNWSWPEPWMLWQQYMNRIQHERAPFIALATAALLLVLGAAAWRASPDEAAVLSVGTIFAALLLTCYYWIMLLAVPLRRGILGPIAVLALNVGLFALDLATPSFEMIYGVMSWGLLVLLLAWAGPDAWATMRRRPAAA